MGTTSQKLTYLNDTKGLLKDRINSLGGNITSQTTFRNYATELDNIYDELPKVSGTGSSINLTPTLKGRITSQMNGDTLQDGTPTPDAPVEIQSVTGRQVVSVCGKNLFSCEIESGTYDGAGNKTSNTARLRSVTNLFVKAGTYTINASGVLSTYIYSSNTGEISTYTPIFSSFTNLPATFTLTSDKYLLFVFNNNNATLSPSDITNIQLEKGSTATTYEPYTGQEYEINLGKNLFNYEDLSSKIQTFTINGNASEFTINGIGTYDYPISLIGQYTFSGNWSTTNLNGHVKVVYEDDTTGNLFSSYSSSSTSGTINFTTTKNVKAIRFQTYNTNNITITNFQIEKGSQASSFSPYFTPIELNNEDSIKRSTGKNLFDKSKITDEKWLTIDGYLETAVQYVVSDYIEVVEGQQYRLPKLDTKRLKYYNANKEALTNSWDISDGSGIQTITIPNNAKYVRFSIHKTVVDINTFMFSKGNTTLPYEPYGKVWYIEKKVGGVIIDNNSTLAVPEIITANNKFMWRYTTAINMAGSGARDNILSNYYEGKTGIYAQNNLIGAYVNNNNLINFATLLSTVGATTSSTTTQTLNLLKTWLQSNNVKVIYPLATPTYTTITNKEQLGLDEIENMSSYKGETNIVIMSENLPTIMNASALKGDL